MSEYLNVDPTEPQGEDEANPENEEGVWAWLVDNTDDLPLSERLEIAESLGRDDIVERLRTQP